MEKKQNKNINDEGKNMKNIGSKLVESEEHSSIKADNLNKEMEEMNKISDEK